MDPYTDGQPGPSASPTFHNPSSKTPVDIKVSATNHTSDLEASRSRDLEDESDFVTELENSRLQRGLHQRHIQMIAIAGAIGTGLFLGLGGSIQTGGPLGALLGYATVGLIVCAVQFALGEVAALLPVTGSFVRHAEFLVDPAFGFAIGLNIVYGNLLSVPAEISAICVLFQYWTDINSALFICIFIFVTFVVGISFVGIYGEVEFWFACLKILLVIFLVIFGLVVDLGGVPGVDRIGFRYWKTPGPFVEYIATGRWGQFLGKISQFLASSIITNHDIRLLVSYDKCSIQFRRRRKSSHGSRRNAKSSKKHTQSLQKGLRTSSNILRPRR
jgi:amino acid transporter